MTILLVSNTRDLTTDLVVHELATLGAPFVRLNCDALDAARPTLSFGCGEPALSFLHKGEAVDARSIKAAYLRRPHLDGMIDTRERDAAHRFGEWRALLEALYSELEGRWLNEPHLIERAEDKARQLRVAAALGFRTPRTLVSNDPARISCAATQMITPATMPPFGTGKT
ncbi:hypothetical protein [Rhodoblastus sp.]|jgi:hypothetical protein|uniref:hypothetical protein n=1 Tax=Rhodoblastus sp. TaxID=1962975 RepID=UPI0025D554D0|nr:hypothetical protein [Rhodoblastus sp.]